MPGTISQYQVVIAGQLITASLWNGMENNIINNGLVPSGIDDYSTSDSEMQVQTDPYPASATSRPTSLQGEIERLRYQIAQITGNTYWYQDAPAIFGNFATHTHDGTSGQGPQILAGGIASDAVTTAKILDSNVTTAKIADSNVTTAKIADSNVTTAKIADSNVTTAKIADANVTSGKLASSIDIATLNVSTALSWKSFTQLKILQVVVGTTSTNTTSTTTSFEDTALSVSITPKISSSNILILTSATVRQNVGDAGYQTIARGTTNLASTNNGFFGSTSNNNYQVTMIAYDAPGTTSATTYVVRQRTAGGGGSIENCPSIGGQIAVASIIAIEIAA